MIIQVCFGSSCHVKGSRRVYARLEDAVREHKLEDKVQIGGTLCLGHCGEPGANMKIDDEIVTGVTEENFDSIFEQKVLSKLK